MSTMFWIWLSVMVITVIVEIITTDLLSIWFTFGAVVPMILSAFDVLDPVWQTAIFVVLSAVLLLSLRKITMKFLFKNTDSKTNVDALVGERHRLLKGIDFETVGAVKIKGIEWRAVAEKQATIEKDKIVEIIRVEGNKLVVKEVVEEKTEDKKEEKSKKEN